MVTWLYLYSNENLMILIIKNKSQTLNFIWRQYYLNIRIISFTTLFVIFLLLSSIISTIRITGSTSISDQNQVKSIDGISNMNPPEVEKNENVLAIGIKPSINSKLYDEYKFNFDFKLQKSECWGKHWDVIKIDEGFTSFIPWQPQVPVKSLPIDAIQEIAEIQVEFSSPSTISTIKLQPAPNPEFIIDPEKLADNQLNSLNTEIESIDTQQKIKEYFSMNKYYPEYDYLLTKLENSKIYFNSDNTIKYTLNLFPCKYNPYLETVILYQSARVCVYYTESETGTKLVDETKPAIKSTPDLRGSRSSNDRPTEDIKYIIITTAELIDELEPLAAWRERKGISTKIVDLETIYQNDTFDGYDEPEELRNFIRYAYNNYNTEYILLAGDWDTVPPRMCHDPDPYYGADDGEIPADSYYACISDDSTWDMDEDHIYGELGDLDDIYPDVAVGRIAINSEQKMKGWVEEIINYECEPNIEAWTSKVIMIGPNVHNEGDGAEQSEYYYDNYLKYVYDSFDKFYESSDQGNKPFSKSEIVNSINSGSTFLNYLGHGGPTSWTYNYGYSGLLNKGDVNSFTNANMKPIVYAMSCLTEWFDDPSDSGYGNFGDCIGETFTENVDNAGIGYIGSARTSVGTIGSGYQPFATGLQEDFIRQLSQFNFILGDAFTEGKKHYSESFGNYFADTHTSGEVQACWLEVNLLGEPLLPLWTTLPQQFNITNNTQENTLIINVKNETNYPVKDALVCLHARSSLGEPLVLKTKLTSSSGDVVFDITGFPSQINLTVSKINFKPYLESITLRDLKPPITQLEITSALPDGENGWYITIPYINLTPNEDAITYYYWDNNSQNNSNSEQVQIYLEPIKVPEGEHILYYYSVDISGNSETVKEFQVKVDSIKPVCALSFSPDAPNGRHGWYIQEPVINITSEPTADIYYAFDEDLTLKYDEPFQAPVGIHELHYYSKDEAGNKGDISNITLKVDITPPKTNLTLSPKDPTGLNGWYLSPPEFVLESEKNAMSYYYWDNNDENISYHYTDPITCEEGVHRLYYYSIDYAGVKEKLKSKLIKVDTTPPLASHELLPAVPDGENEFYVSEVLITLRSEQNATIYYQWDSNTAVSYTTPIHGQEGIHTITYYSVDEAGNKGNEFTFEQKIDTIKPDTDISITPALPSGNDNWYTQIPNIEFRTEPGAVVYYRFEYTLETIAETMLEIPEGINTLYFYSIDEAGNIGPEQYREFKVDITPPSTHLETDLLTHQIEDIISFEASNSEDNFGISGYLIDFGDGSSSGWSNSPVIKHKYEKPGEYKVTLITRDAAGLESEKEFVITILILEEDEGTDDFKIDNFLLPIMIILAILIILSSLFALVYRSYRESTSGTKSVTEFRVDRAGIAIEPEHDLEYEIEAEPAEAIILHVGTAHELKRLKCVGCGTLFSGDPSSGQLRCPGCGYTGGLRSKKGSKESSEKKGMGNKFKCPSCGTIFRSPIDHGLIKCPSCGVKGEI